jgi:acyl dehydratase
MGGKGIEGLSAEFNKGVDQWVLERNKLQGDIILPQLGYVPPPSGLYGLNNELITTDFIRHYADAIGDKNPLWRSEEYARRTRWGGIIAPPTILDCIGTAGEGRGSPPLGFFFTKLRGGAKSEWFKPMRPGDKIHIIGVDMGVEEKHFREERPYRLFACKVKTTYMNQRDETIANRIDSYITVVAPTKEQINASFEEKKKHKYTQEELNYIHRCYEEEERRGAEILFWEDVAEGEELKPIVAGPIDVIDCQTFMGVIGYQVAFGLKWDRMKDLLDDHCWFDTETNTYRWQAEVHLNEACCRAIDIPGGPIGLDAQFEGMLCHLIYNWMGDSGFLKTLDCQTRRPIWHGDTAWMKGKVTRKYVENGEHLVDLDVHCENQDGIIFMPAKATAKLISRNDL